MGGMDVLLLTGAAAGIAGLWWLKKTAVVAPTGSNQATAISMLTQPPSRDFLPILDTPALFGRTGADAYIAKIRQRLGFTPESYARDVQPLFNAFAQFVQLLPASESHHHAQPGGLLVHLLEVAAHALHFRDAYKLPKGASPEEQTRLSARYSYAVLVAALLHDIGKPVSDVEVTLATGIGEKKSWVPLAGTMSQQGGLWYRVEFAPERDYRKHERMGLPLLRVLVPGPALAWLGEYRPLMDELMQVMSGEDSSSVLKEVIKKADGESVRENLLHGPRTRFASARAVPLIERLMAGLRRLLEEGHVPLNRAGATGFSDGKHLWFVAGTIANAVRDYLNRNETRAVGEAGIPEDNSRLFDTWAEYGALTLNSQAGAIWSVKLTIGQWKQTLTMVRFPLEKLYSDPSRYPPVLPPGAIFPIQIGSETKETLASQSEVQPAEISPISEKEESAACTHRDTDSMHGAALPSIQKSDVLAPQLTPKFSQLDEGEPTLDENELPDNAAQPLFEDLALMPPVVPAAADDEFLDDADSANAQFGTAAQLRVRSEPPEVMRAPVSPKSKEASVIPMLSGKPGAKKPPHPNVDRFMAWLQEGIRNGTLTYNETQAVVHFCDEGMLVVSPRIFREYADAFEARIELTQEQKTEGRESWRILQQQFQKSGYPIKAPQGSFLWRYNVSGPGGKQLIGNVVSQPQRFFDPVPNVNTALKLSPAMPAK